MVTDGGVQITDGQTQWTLTADDFSASLDEATDGKYIVYFFVHGANSLTATDASADDYNMLLQLQAAGRQTQNSVFDTEDCDDFTVDVDEVGDEDRMGAPAHSGVGESERDEGDEAVVTVGNDILRSLRLEVERFQKDENPLAPNTANEFACPFCPFRAWPCSQSRQRVYSHVGKYHVSRVQYVPSGTKQIKIIISLHDFDPCYGRERSMYLQRSASILRSTAQHALPRQRTEIDRHCGNISCGL